MGKVIGIDLGTTYSAVAVVNEHGRAEILANREGERVTPSVVLIEEAGAVVGSIAKRSAVASPLNVVQFVKRQMGNPSWKFRSEDGVAYKPEEISALILKRLKEDSEALLGETVTEAVITVPAYFNDAQRKATQDAGRLAGLLVRRIINEPTAAALAYGIERSSKDETVLVYDLGGGTFDVTIMRVGGGGIEVVATGGDKNLGGFDWDNALMGFLNAEFMRQGGADLMGDPALEQDLRDKAEIAKRTLSSRDKTAVFLSAAGKTASVALTFEQFNELTASLIQRTGRIMEMVREDAKLDWSEIDKVLLVGGSTRMRAVPALVEKIAGRKPSMELHPDEVVAVGAAMQGAVLQAKSGEGSHAVREQYSIVEIRDVLSHSMGVIALNEMEREFNSIILTKDTETPCEASEIYHTVANNQRKVNVRVTQGEDQDPAYVTLLAEAPLDIPPYPKGAPLQVTFRFDEDQVLHVSVRDLTANKDLGEVPVPRIANLTGEQVDQLSAKLSRVVVS